MAYNNQIVDNEIAVDNKIFEDFRPKHAVIVNYGAFIERLKSGDLKTNYAVSLEPVNYRILTIKDSKEILLDKNRSLFYKHPYFFYQQEFRIMVHEDLGRRTVKRELEGNIVDVIDGYNNKIYYLKKNLQRIAKITNVQNCNKSGDYTYIDLNLGR